MKIDIKYKKKSGIYEICHNDKKYIGSSKDLYGRLTVHISHLQKNKHHSKYMQRCFNKYGRESFIINILKVIDYNEDELRNLELHYINLYKPVFNSTTPITYNHSEEMKNKISNTLKLGYKSGKIPHPRFNKGIKYNIYNSKGELLYSDMTISYVVNILKLSNRSVVDNYIRKTGGFYINSNMDYICVREDKTILDFKNYLLSLNNFNNLHVYRIKGDLITRVFNKHRFISKIISSKDLIYYSKITNSYYTFIGLFKNAVLDSNI